MYFKDGHVEETHYGVKMIKIAWLDKGKPYTKGKCPPEFLEKLKKQDPAAYTKGWHDCPFCETRSKETTSSTQFQWPIKGKTYYDVPFMIIHYIEEHGYLPPQEFIDFVMTLPDEVGSRSYYGMKEPREKTFRSRHRNYK